MPTATIKGLTTIRWGTAAQSATVGLLAPAVQSGVPAAIVKKASRKRAGGDPVLIEDGAGFSSIWVGINDGDIVEFECVDDTAVTWPVFGDTLILRPTGGAANLNFICEDNNPEIARKADGLRNVKARYYVNIAVS